MFGNSIIIIELLLSKFGCHHQRTDVHFSGRHTAQAGRVLSVQTNFISVRINHTFTVYLSLFHYV